MKLQSMTDYVLEQLNINQSTSEFKESIKKYANFLRLKLEKWMFIPCDSDGSVLEEPNRSAHTNLECEQYQQAKENIIFDGFYIRGNNLYYNKRLFWNGDDFGNYIIEDLIITKTHTQYDLTLTENAIKKYKL